MGSLGNKNSEKPDEMPHSVARWNAPFCGQMKCHILLQKNFGSTLFGEIKYAS